MENLNNQTSNERKIVGIYIRVSTEDQARVKIIKDMNIKNRLRLGVCLTQSEWSNILYNKAEMYEKFDTKLKEIDEEYRTKLVDFSKYKIVMFIMAKIMEMKQCEINKIALYLFNTTKI